MPIGMGIDPDDPEDMEALEAIAAEMPEEMAERLRAAAAKVAEKNQTSRKRQATVYDFADWLRDYMNTHRDEHVIDEGETISEVLLIAVRRKETEHTPFPYIYWNQDANAFELYAFAQFLASHFSRVVDM